MERTAAVKLLLEAADKHEKSGQFKFSNIVTDLARRVALSNEGNDINLEKYCSKMAAELMFRDDYRSADKILKLAEVAPDPNVLPLNPVEEFKKRLEGGGAIVMEPKPEALEEPETKVPEGQESEPLETDNEPVSPTTPESSEPGKTPVTSLDDLKRSLLRMGVRPDQLI